LSAGDRGVWVPGLSRLPARLARPDTLGFLLATGVTTWIAFQAFVHVAGTTNVLPLTGVPLPFISSGGSSLVACLFGIGLLLNISRHRVEVMDNPVSPAAPASRRERRAG